VHEALRLPSKPYRWRHSTHHLTVGHSDSQVDAARSVARMHLAFSGTVLQTNAISFVNAEEFYHPSYLPILSLVSED
jgi:fatty acid desaturase